MFAGTVRYRVWIVVAAHHKCKDELFIFSKEEKRTLGSSSNGINAFFFMKLDLKVRTEIEFSITFDE